MKVKNFFSRIPRPVKACFCAFLVIVAAAVYYIALGCPALTLRQEFRRAEKAHLVGPSKIVDTLYGNRPEYDAIIVGETEYGICCMGKIRSYQQYFWEMPNYRYDFSYVEKAGDITVFAIPNTFGILWDSAGFNLPVYFFTDYTEAANAEVEIFVRGTDIRTVNSESIETAMHVTFSSDAALPSPGVIRCTLTSTDKASAYALYHLSNILSGNPYQSSKSEIRTMYAIISLYDNEGELILQEKLDLLNADE